MKRCKHPAHRVWVRPGYAYVQRRYASCTFDGQRKCHACGAVVPYGPSSDSGPHAASVACEVRAAELAQHYAEHENLVEFASAEEMGGWFMRYLDQEYRPRKNAEARYAKSLAGYLAFEIAHGHEPDTRTTKDPQ